MSKPDSRQITDLDQLAGKTIARAMYLDPGDNNELVFIFTDETFVYIVPHPSWGLCVDDPAGFDERVKMGIATAAEIEAKRIEDEDRERRQQASDLEHRRRQYERLRKEFEEREFCPKGGICEWKIDGQHSNEYCGKCFRDKP